MEQPRQGRAAGGTEAAPVVLRTLPGASPTKVSLEQVSFWYGKFKALNEVTLEVPEKRVTALIGPSGCGKSTLLRTLTRMYDLVPGRRAEGRIMLDGEDVIATRSLMELR
ncbi:MAG TPA: ATP-binding cassette domain-containing protein, partial [Terriglobales bacterium]|nr:ATP-binding cassette domain-containing protein [Terriglobales bacterium]